MITLNTKRDEMLLFPWRWMSYGPISTDGAEGLKVEYREYDDGDTYPVFKLPELAPKIGFDGNVIVAELLGKRWLISVLVDRVCYGMPSEATVTFAETSAKITPLNAKSQLGHWFGQPSFIQGEVIPVLDGRCAYNLCTIESGWGDCGNENIMIGFDKDNNPAGIYMEFSCC